MIKIFVYFFPLTLRNFSKLGGAAVLGQSGSRKFHRLQGSQQSIFRAILPLKKEKTA